MSSVNPLLDKGDGDKHEEAAVRLASHGCAAPVPLWQDGGRRRTALSSQHPFCHCMLVRKLPEAHSMGPGSFHRYHTVFTVVPRVCVCNCVAFALML